MDPLWAKSGQLRRTLVQHTGDVVSALRAMFDSATCPSRLAKCWARFFKLSRLQPFFDSSLAAAVLHDWGKANNGFQNAVTGRGPQLIRHEHLSALVMTIEQVDKWLKSREGVDWDVVLSAVLTHHLKAKDDLESLAGQLTEMTEPKIVLLRVDHEEFQEMLRLTAAELNLTGPYPELPRRWSFGQTHNGAINIIEQRDVLCSRLLGLEKAIRRDQSEQRKRLLWAVRTALIAADAAASGIFRTGRDLTGWLNEAFDDTKLLRREDIWSKVIDPRVNQLKSADKWNESNGLGGWNEFQIECERQPARSLLLAPCGSGKTLAAWRWIAQQCGAGVKRVIFLYPTRATATEGFRDYVSWAPEDEGALMHGKSEYDLLGMFDNPDEGGTPDPRRKKRFETDPRLFALAFWPRTIFSATVDQFLAFLQYGYGPMCLLPLLADSVVVVDEVHSFDRSMISALKDFLQTFDVPVLCMTATLQKPRRLELESDCGLTTYDSKPGELRTIASAPRYRIAPIERSEVSHLIRRELKAKRRVLWVVNKVRRAQQAALELTADLQPGEVELKLTTGDRLLCYHSRFRLADRRERHRDAIRAFQGDGPAALAVTTQVCEMSLDMDADVLITERAPITSLIQRMGRCNRSRNPRSEAGCIFVYQPEDDGPYRPNDFAGVTEFLDFVCSKPHVNQVDLEAGLADFGPDVADVQKDSNFLKSGPYAMGGEESFRDIDEFTVPAVLDSDIDKFCSDRRAAPGYVVPVPLRAFRDRRDERLPNFLVAAPDAHYHPAVGFCDGEVVRRRAASRWQR